MEGTVWYEHSNFVSLLLDNFPGNGSKFVSPSLPKVWIIVVTNSDGRVLRAHDQHRGSLDIGVGVSGAIITTNAEVVIKLSAT